MASRNKNYNRNNRKEYVHKEQKNDRNDNNSIDSNEEFPIKLTMWDFGQCDITKCTGRKLERLNCLKTLKLSQSSQGVILR